MARRIYYDHFTISFLFQHFNMIISYNAIVLERC